MHAMNVALTDLPPRAASAGAPSAEHAPADDGAAPPDRAAQRGALLASLWPAPTLQCVAAPHFVELPAPAVFGIVFRVTWPAPRSPLQAPEAGHRQAA